MNCEILETLYMKSNGDIPCDCDFGEALSLGRVDTENREWDIIKLFENEKYTHIKKSFLSDQVPWPRICPQCAFFRPKQAYSNAIEQKNLYKIQVEPSLICNLACPCCNNPIQTKTKSQPHLMEPKVFETVLSSLNAHQFSVKQIEYCGQGEPLAHPHFSTFIEIGRQYFPLAQYRLITNGNFDYQKKLGGYYLEEIYVSCDGVFQKNYEKYRRKGNVAKVLKFMENIPNQIDGKKQWRVWKYILFEFNDSEEELIEAQKIAYTMGIDSLLFIFTHSKYKSSRYTQENVNEFPILYPNVTTNVSATLGQYFKNIKPVNATKAKFRWWYHSTLLEIDKVSIYNTVIMIQGWVLAKQKVTYLELLIDNHQLMGVPVLNLLRQDVFNVFPQYNNLNSGFYFSAPMSNVSIFNEQQIVIKVFVYHDKQKIGQFERRFQFKSI